MRPTDASAIATSVAITAFVMLIAFNIGRAQVLAQRGDCLISPPPTATGVYAEVAP